MSLSTSISLLRGVTAMTPTGGAANTYINDGRGTNGKKSLVNSTNTNLVLRESLITSLTVGYMEPNANTNAKLYRAGISGREPYKSVIGRMYVPGFDFSMSFHPEEAPAVRTQRLMNALAVIADAELANMLTAGVND